MVDEAHGDGDADEAVLADAQEVDVERMILDRIDLHVAGNDADLLTAGDVDIEHRRGEVTLDELLPEIIAVDGDGLGGLIVTIDDGGDIPFTASLACGPLACTWARRGFELGNLCHGFSPMKIGP